MILLDIPARMVCVEEGCTASEPVSLALQGAGGFAFKPTQAGKEWQIVAPLGGAGTFLCRCPDHRKQVVPVMAQIGPSGPRIVEKVNGR